MYNLKHKKYTDYQKNILFNVYCWSLVNYKHENNIYNYIDTKQGKNYVHGKLNLTPLALWRLCNILDLNIDIVAKYHNKHFYEKWLKIPRNQREADHIFRSKIWLDPNKYIEKFKELKNQSIEIKKYNRIMNNTNLIKEKYANALILKINELKK